MTSLLVALEDRISDWAEKGEVTRGYFNPTGMFDQIELLLTNDDEPDPAVVERLTWPATAQVHNVGGGRGYFVATFGYRIPLLRRWRREVARVARTTNPDIVRCYGTRLNGLAAVVAKDATRAPLAASLHVQPERDWRRRLARTPVHAYYARRMRWLEASVLGQADVILPVYSSIAHYLEKRGFYEYEVVHNAVGTPVEGARRGEGGSERMHIVTVGRQLAGHKDPSSIIRAVAQVPDVVLTVVGDGPLHANLVALAENLHVDDRVRFIGSLPNPEVMALLAGADVFAYSTTYAELSKAVIEATLSGLPVVHAEGPADEVAELHAPGIELVPDTAHGFARAFRALAADPDARRRRGTEARRHATATWAPAQMEERTAAIYQQLLGGTM